MKRKRGITGGAGEKRLRRNWLAGFRFIYFAKFY